MSIEIPKNIDLGLPIESEKLKTQIVIKSKNYQKSDNNNFTPDEPIIKREIKIHKSNERKNPRNSSSLF